MVGAIDPRRTERPSCSIKKAESDEIKKQTDEYLKRGGEIKSLDIKKREPNYDASYNGRAMNQHVKKEKKIKERRKVSDEGVPFLGEDQGPNVKKMAAAVERKKKAIALKREGASDEEISIDVGVSMKTLYRYFKEEGLTTDRGVALRKRMEETRLKVIDAIKAGKGITYIYKTLNVSCDRAYKIASEEGLEIAVMKREIK